MNHIRMKTKKKKSQDCRSQKKYQIKLNAYSWLKKENYLLKLKVSTRKKNLKKILNGKY